MKQHVNSAILGFSEQNLHTLLELISDGIWDWNANTGAVYRNPGWYSMLGYPRDSLSGTVGTWENIIHPDDYPRVMEHFRRCITQDEQYQIEYRCQCRNGTYLWIEDRARIIARNPDGSVARMLGVHKNIDAAKRLILNLQQKNKSLETIIAERTAELLVLNQQLQHRLKEYKILLERDPLTLAANRYGLERALSEQCERARLFRQPLSAIVLDVDDFKEINDKYGHLFGDTTLIKIADCIRSSLREKDVVARWGGDEFVLVLPETAHEEAEQVACLIQRNVNQIWQPDEQQIKLTLSFGVVQFRENETQIDFLERADKALYRAKGAGKNSISR